jgi:hypothetical protein
MCRPIADENVLGQYKEGQSSVHGRVGLKRTGEGLQGVFLQSRDGVQVERKSHVSSSCIGVSTRLLS